MATVKQARTMRILRQDSTMTTAKQERETATPAKIETAEIRTRVETSNDHLYHTHKKKNRLR